MSATVYTKELTGDSSAYLGGTFPSVEALPCVNDVPSLRVMEDYISDPFMDFAGFIYDGSYLRMGDTVLMLPKQIYEDEFTWEDQLLTSRTLPKLYEFNTIEDVVKAFDIFKADEPAPPFHFSGLFGPQEMLLMSFLRDAIVGGRLFPGVPNDKLPNFFVYHRLSGDRAGEAFLAFYRIDPTAKTA